MSAEQPAVLERTERTRGRRVHQRVGHALAEMRAVLDAAAVAHVGYVQDGTPFVTPTFHWRDGDTLYWHGASASRALRASEDAEVCVTVTILDGWVLARSAFHHSANYRSVMVFGRPRRIEDEAEKARALRGFVERRFPGRWDQMRAMHAQELKATAILALPIAEASVKMRSGGPVDDAEDMDAALWAGVVPLVTGLGAPQPDGAAAAAYPLPVVAA